MSQVLRVITFNVGGWGDSQRLLKLFDGRDADEPAAVAWYQDRVKDAVIDGKIYGQEADILCLQELYDEKPGKGELYKRITDGGFTVLGQGDLAIAYKTDRFTPIEGKQGHTQGRAFYAYFHDKITHRTICVVTDHVKGFDSRTQKVATRALKELSINPWKGIPWQGNERTSIENSKKKEPSIGDENLEKSLKEIGQDADLIVYGLDANTTADYIPKGNDAPRLHPKRLRKLTAAGFKCDTNDMAPTIIEHNLDRRFTCKDRMPKVRPAPNLRIHPVNDPKGYNLDADVSMKFDYAFFRPKDGLEILITSRALGPLPQEFAKLLSDHRPVYAEIRLPSLGLSSRFFSAIFKGFLNFMSFLGRLPVIFWNLFAPGLSMKHFDAHFQNDSNYNYLKTHAGNNLGLLLAAGVTPQELAGYFNMNKSLETLLQAKNARDSQARYHDTPAQICEFFIVWCVLKKLQGESWKIKFETFEEFRKNLRTNLKTGLEKLRDHPSTPVEQKCSAYIKQHMQSADLLK